MLFLASHRVNRPELQGSNLIHVGQWFQLRRVACPENYCDSCERFPLPIQGVGSRCDSCPFPGAYAHLKHCGMLDYEDWCNSCLNLFAEYDTATIPDALGFVRSLADSNPEDAYDTVQRYANYWRDPLPSEYWNNSGTFAIQDVFCASLPFELDYLKAWFAEHCPSEVRAFNQTVDDVAGTFPEHLSYDLPSRRCEIAREVWPELHRAFQRDFDSLRADVIRLSTKAVAFSRQALPPIGDGDARFVFVPPKASTVQLSLADEAGGTFDDGSKYETRTQSFSAVVPMQDLLAYVNRTNDNPECISGPQLAKRLDVSERTINSWIGVHIKPVKRGKPHLFRLRETIKRIAEAQQLGKVLKGRPPIDRQ